MSTSRWSNLHVARKSQELKTHHNTHNHSKTQQNQAQAYCDVQRGTLSHMSHPHLRMSVHRAPTGPSRRCSLRGSTLRWDMYRWGLTRFASIRASSRTSSTIRPRNLHHLHTIRNLQVASTSYKSLKTTNQDTGCCMHHAKCNMPRPHLILLILHAPTGAHRCLPSHGRFSL